MSVDVREWMPDVFQYKLTFLYIGVQLLAVTRWPRRLGAQPSIRSAADMTWFMPVFVWGLESLHHLVWWLSESHGFCFGIPPAATFERAELTSVLMVGALLQASCPSIRPAVITAQPDLHRRRCHFPFWRPSWAWSGPGRSFSPYSTCRFREENRCLEMPPNNKRRRASQG